MNAQQQATAVTVEAILARVEAFALRQLDVPPGSSEPGSLAFTAGARYVADEALRLVSDLRAEVAR